eukprot:NODE_52_length_30984_cov_1.383358.p15 type:complete len:337 gc:universal NODE_52_length_30984_cov_1.383358:4035-3025(-)
MSKIKRILFLGTGTSGSVPNLTCLGNKDLSCVCKNYLINPDHPDVRNNTSILVTLEDEGIEKNILIDCGKTFRHSALKFFSLHNITTIHAVFLSHGHADAMLGLDDLREFTALNKIPVYCSKDTLKVVSCAFPYLVDVEKASGGGDVAKLEFIECCSEKKDKQVCDSNNTLTKVTIFNHNIYFLPVYHGFNPDGSELISYGFKFENLFAYISDAVNIPPQTSYHLRNVPIVVLDALNEVPHKSHFSIHQAIEEFKKFGTSFGLFVGYSHRLGHNRTIELVHENNLHAKCPLNVTMIDELNNFDRKFAKYVCRQLPIVKEGLYLAPTYDGMIIEFDV